jgi:2-isopropylmalate synthase
VTGIQVQRNKAIVGRNAFAHEAGIHQDGVLKERTTYEIMRAEDVGFAKNDLVLGKHSGRAALADRAKNMGYTLNNEQLQVVFENFKVLADKKKEIYDGDIASLIEQEILTTTSAKWSFESYCIAIGSDKTPIVDLSLRRGDSVEKTQFTGGDGPIDAIFLAIEKMTGIHVECSDFQVHSVTMGKDAQGEVSVIVEHGGQTYRGRGVSTDCVEASAMAFLNAINRLEAAKKSE